MIQNYSQEVFSGNRLFDTCQYQEDDPHFFLMGHSAQGEPMRIPVGEQMLSRHLLLLGGIGTGKSNAFHFLIRNVRSSLTDRDVAIIFDTKGDFYREFYQPGDVVISNDSRASGGSGPDYWNLFGEISIDDRIEENILEIAKSFFSEKLAHTTQPFFPNAAKDLFGALLLHMVRSEQFKEMRNNQALRAAFDTFSVSAMKKILQSHQDLKAMTSYIEDEKSGQTLGVVAELQQMVREIFVGNFRKKGSLSMRQLVRQKGGRVIFVEYDLGIGAKFFVGIQNIDQIAAAYGQDMAHSILSGFGTTLAFRVNDAGSREYIKGLFGRNIKLQTYLSAVQNRGVSEQIREGFVVEDEDITNLPVGQAIIGAPGCQPFRFQFKKY